MHALIESSDLIGQLQGSYIAYCPSFSSKCYLVPSVVDQHVVCDDPLPVASVRRIK